MPEQATVLMAPAATGGRWQVDHWFYIGVALLMILFNIAAFGPSLVNSTGRLGPPTTLVAAHAVVSFGFLLFFLAQATLVATGRTALHRRLGIVGGVLAAAMIVLTYAMSIEMLRRGYDMSGDLQRLEFGGQSLPSDALRDRVPDLGIGLALNVSQVVSFGILVAAAIWYRRRPDVHRRLMLLAMLGVLTGPPFAHMFGHWAPLRAIVSIVQLPITILLLSVSAIHDHLTEGRVHRASLWPPILLFVWFGVWVGVIGPSPAWQALATRLIR
jgi:hypothetical protein